MKNIYSYILSAFIMFYPLKITYALSYDWVTVPQSQFGEQIWDKKNMQTNKDGSIRVFSKFIPRNSNGITQNILYTMDIDCSKTLFKDVAIGTKKFNEIKNKDLAWKSPNGDKLILSLIQQVCTVESEKRLAKDRTN